MPVHDYVRRGGMPRVPFSDIWRKMGGGTGLSRPKWANFGHSPPSAAYAHITCVCTQFRASAAPQVRLGLGLTSPLYSQVRSAARESRESSRNQATALLNFLVNCLWQEGKISIFSMARRPGSALPCWVCAEQSSAEDIGGGNADAPRRRRPRPRGAPAALRGPGVGRRRPRLTFRRAEEPRRRREAEAETRRRSVWTAPARHLATAAATTPAPAARRPRAARGGGGAPDGGALGQALAGQAAAGAGEGARPHGRFSYGVARDSRLCGSGSGLPNSRSSCRKAPAWAPRACSSLQSSPAGPSCCLRFSSLGNYITHFSVNHKSFCLNAWPVHSMKVWLSDMWNVVQ